MKTATLLLAMAVGWLAPAGVHAAGPPPPPPPPSEDEPVGDSDTLVVDDDEPDPPADPPEPTVDSVETDTAPDGDDDDASLEDATEPVDEPDDDEPDDDDDDDDEPDDDKAPFRSKYLKIEGYVQPQYTFIQRRGARARFQREFGAEQTRAGLKFSGEPLDRWSYRIHIVIGAAIAQVVTGNELVDYEGDGAVDDLYTERTFLPGLGIEQLWVNYNPIRFTPDEMQIIRWDIRLGQMRAPISRQNSIQNDSLLFPRRNAANNVFSSRYAGQTTLAPDVGALTELGFADQRVRAQAGIFNGTGLAIRDTRERGPFYVTRMDIEPLGKLRKHEGDLDPAKKFMFGVGGAFGYRPYRVYDRIGNDTLTRVRDLYGNASAYMSIFGLHLQGEFLRRQTTDNLSSRPSINTSAYGQVSYAIPLPGELHLVPQGNFSWLLIDEASNPQRRLFTQDGVALYLGNDFRQDAIRILLLYLGEWRLDEQESAQGGTVQLQIKF